jgi:hypothetical protein
MKIAALVLGILGSLAVVLLGVSWVGQYKELEKSETYTMLKQSRTQDSPDPLLGEVFAKAERLGNAGYANFAMGIIALVCAPFVFKVPKVSGTLMALAVVVPAVLEPRSLIASFLLALAALFAFLAKPPARAVA